MILTGRSTVEQESGGAVPVHMIRLLVFAVFAAFNMVSSFLPVYNMRNTDIIPETWRDFAASLPFTVNIFVMGVMSLLCAKAVRRMGIRRILILSMSFSLGGNLLMFLVQGYAGVFVGLLLDGIGVGLVTNVIYVVLTFLPDESTRQTGFSTYNAASLSGINLGMIIGSILAVYVGQKYVFLTVALLWGLLMILAAWLVRRLQGTLSLRDDPAETEKSGISAGRFLRSKPIWSFFC